MRMTKHKRLISVIAVVVVLCSALVPLLTSCGLYESAMESENMGVTLMEGGDLSQAVSGGGEERMYFDEKSGMYVTPVQYRVNSFADALKAFWVPVSAVSFVIGFLLRRFIHDSAAIRKFGITLEIGIPVFLTVFVYAVCFFADSSIIHFFDSIF
jgi:hypothetical protein